MGRALKPTLPHRDDHRSVRLLGGSLNHSSYLGRLGDKDSVACAHFGNLGARALIHPALKLRAHYTILCGQDGVASFCRETPGFMLACVSFPIKLGTTDDRCRVSPSVLTRFLSRFHELPRWTARGRNDLRRSLPRVKDRESQAAFRLRDDRSANRAAIFMRLLASTAAATHSSKRSRPSARQRFMPRPRNNTEMRPSMPARKRWPSLNCRLFS